LINYLDIQLPQTYSKKILENGLKVILVPDNNKEVATALVLFGVGSRYEDDSVAGISHFLEHMFFKGTTTRPSALAIAEYIEELGGEQNAFTSKEYTGFYVKAASSYLGKTIPYLADLLLNPIFSPKEFEREKGVIVQELNMYEDMPMEMVGSKFELALFGNNSLGRDVIGYRKSIEGLSHDKLVSYKQDHYVAPNAVFVIAGGMGELSESEILDLVKDQFQMNKAKVPEFNKEAFPQTRSRILVTKNTEQSHLAIGFPGVDYANPDRYALKMLALILGGSMSSRMFTEIREKRGLAYAVRSSTTTYLDTGTIETYAGVPHDKIYEVMEAIIGQYLQARETITDQEVGKAKQIVKGRMLLGFEDSSEVANHYALGELMTGSILTKEEVIAKYEALTTNDILGVANKYINLSKIAISFIGPKIDEQSVEKIIS